ncbi:hypothetical protein M422DRAFT_49537 [Sphaerobolus stellatus SS14]|uniref:Uncharacterized protein n=1 Tax=Sphaerobolus stellatus (strain SS14) TaxID=990650 RepID=A0A0C9UXS3_SPHS4|nr:hypothetical protein M422DRAFT_49537 [Sphaerobolus stellatus SS14]
MNNVCRRICKSFAEAIEAYGLKKKALIELEEALGRGTVEGLRAHSALADGSQFRPRVIEQPSHASILKLLQQEDGFGTEYGERSTRATRGVGINRGLEVELRQVVFKYQRDTQLVATDTQWNKLQDSRHKLSQVMDSWFRKLGELMPVTAIEALVVADVGPEDMMLGLPSDFPKKDHVSLGICNHALIERELRVAQAHDALKKLRTQLGLKSFLVRRKRQNPGYTVAT